VNYSVVSMATVLLSEEDLHKCKAVILYYKYSWMIEMMIRSNNGLLMNYCMESEPLCFRLFRSVCLCGTVSFPV